MLITTEGARLIWELRESWDPTGGPQDVGHACVTRGRRVFSMPTFLGSHPMEREQPGVVIN